MSASGPYPDGQSHSVVARASAGVQMLVYSDVGKSRPGTQSGIAWSPDHFRAVTLAIAELRRGAAVVVRHAGASLAVAAAETAAAYHLAELRRWAGSPEMVIWSRPECGVGAVAAGPVAPDLSPVQLASRRGGTEHPAPAGAVAAALLARHARLLPVLLAAPLDLAGRTRADESAAIHVEAVDISAFGSTAAHIVRVGEAAVPLEDAATARVVAFRNPESGAEHLAVVIGTPTAGEAAPLVRLHSECFTGDVLGSLRCDCGPQLRAAMRRMAEEGGGVVLYLAQEGRGIGLLNKLRAYALQDKGLDTVDANAALGYGPDERDFTIAANMLRDLGISQVRLLTNNPDKIAALAAAGIGVERASLLVSANGVNDGYLATKAARFGHLLG